MKVKEQRFLSVYQCPGHYAFLTIVPLAPQSSHKADINTMSTNEDTETALVNLLGTQMRRQDFIPGLFGSKVHIFFPLYTWRNWPKFTQQVIKKNTKSGLLTAF